jgi:hypothetical protein
LVKDRNVIAAAERKKPGLKNSARREKWSPSQPISNPPKKLPTSTIDAM